MKKLTLMAAAVLCIGLTAFAQDNGKCVKKCTATDQAAGGRANAVNKKSGTNEWVYGLKCSSHNAVCQENEKKSRERKGARAKK